jgi:beta-mannosidase
MGRQTLYDVTTTLLDETGATLDSDSRQIGLRTLHLEREPDEWGESFQFVANGVPFFAKGANWIPADTFIPRLSEAHYSRLLRDAAAVNMNMVRVWGGGIYEQDVFYELCDRLGLCVWQDFMFACAAYPTFDEAYLATVQAEIEDNVRRLRHRPSLALWCGNNELEQSLVGEAWTDTTMNWADYSRLFDQLLPNILARLDPQRDYWPASPHTPLGDRYDFNNPTCGDAHIWNVWHGLEPFEFYRGCKHRFNSEFGFQSFPEPATVYSYTTPPDHNITSPVMEHHQRSGIGNVTIIQYLLSWFRMPTSFEHTLWLSQIQQGMAIKYAVEHWRRTMPRGMGTLYWQLNDCWPVASWSSLDSFGRWKALHYMARHFYAPLLLSGVEALEAGAVDIHLTSDLLADTTGRVSWWLTTVAGDQVDNGQLQVDIPARQNRLVTRLDLRAALAHYGPRNLLLWLELTLAGETVSSNLILLARPKQLELEPPQLRAAIEQIGPGQFTVRLSARKPALWAWLELPEIEARYADNFFHLRPNLPRTITVTTTADLSPEQLKGSLRLQSLINTY